MGVRITLLGGASLEADERSVPRMERKSAALVAYLALSGPTVRTRIAGFLWPESPEKTARNNLAQVVRRLREAAGTSVVEGDATVAISPNVDVDVARLEILVQRGQHTEAASRRGALLDGFDYDDCAELDGWLAGQRERTRRAQRRACAAEAERLEREGHIEDALARTRADVDADPLDEEATRRHMRLLYRTGRTAESLRAYEGFKQKLHAELGTTPHADTTALATSIRSGAAATKERTSQVPAVTAPLVGRSAEWAKLEDAWKRRVGVVVVGAPGIGKSRLIHDFAASKGVATQLGGRPGDVAVPYATIARLFKQLLERFSIALPDWAKRELARIVPSLGAAPDGAIDKLRFFEALSEAMRTAVAKGMSIVSFDDLQFIDAASLEALEHVFSGFWSGESSGLRTFFAARRSMHAELDARLRRAEDAGLLVRVVLEPLEKSAVIELLGEDAALAGRADEVHAIAAGNPFFVLEIVKGVQSGELDSASSLARGRRATELVAQRLEPLSSSALRLARLAAIAGTAFDLDLAAEVLEVPALDLVTPLTELSEAQVFHDSRFSHDLMQEIVDAQTPAAVRAFVHARVAAHLVKRGDEPARAAQHWADAGRLDEAAQLFVKAGDRAQMLSRLTEGAAFYHRAADLFESIGERSQAFKAVAELRRFARQLGMNELPKVIEQMTALASSPIEEARVNMARASQALYDGTITRARELILLALNAELTDPWVECEAWQQKFFIELNSNDLAAAEEARIAMSAAAERVGHFEAYGAVIWHAAQIAAQQDRHRDAIARFEETLAVLEREGPHHWSRARFLAHVARSHLILGDAKAAEAKLAEAARYMGHFDETAQSRLEIEFVQTRFDMAVGNLDAVAKIACRHVAAPDPIFRATGRVRLAQIAACAGRADLVSQTIADAMTDGTGLPTTLARVILARASLEHVASEEDVRLVSMTGSPLDAVRVAMRAPHADARAELRACDEARAAIEQREARAYLAEATAYTAAAKMKLGNREGALADVARARSLADAHPPVDFPRGLLDGMLAKILRDAKEDAREDEARARSWKERAEKALAIAKTP